MYSMDLRERVVLSVEGGLSRRSAAGVFGVSPSTVVSWVKRWRESGTVSPQGVGGDRRSAVIEVPSDWLFARLSEAPDTSLEEYRSALGERGLRVSVGTVWRFFDRHGISVKKTAHTAEQDRPDVAEARIAWRAGQHRFDPKRLVFIDETGASTKMTRLCGRVRKGERLLAPVPRGHWKTTTFVAGLRHDRITAPWSSIAR